MKKAVILLAFLFAAIMPASAETIKVEALSDFTTENPPETLPKGSNVMQHFHSFLPNIQITMGLYIK